MRSLAILVLLILVAAAEAPRGLFRYQPAPRTAWVTQGTLSVRSWIGWPAGEETMLEESDLGWTDVVTDRQPGRTILSRTIERWTRRDTGENQAGEPPVQVSVTDLLGLPEHDLLDQPDLYPAARVSEGESWPINQPDRLEALPLGDRILVLKNETEGTGRLLSLRPELATLEADVTVLSVGSDKDLASRSQTRSHWRIELDRSDGVPREQTVVIVTTQSLTLNGTTVPSRCETSLRLTTRPLAVEQEVDHGDPGSR